MTRMAAPIGALWLLALTLTGGCIPKSGAGARAGPPTPPLPSSVRQKLDAFDATPDEDHFLAVVCLANEIDDPRLLCLATYVLYSRKLTPVDDPAVNTADVEFRLRARASGDFELVEHIMTRHRDPWRRWTMAGCVGEFGGERSLPALRQMATDTNADVRNAAAVAIDAIQGRREAAR